MTLVDNGIDPSAVLQAASESIIVTTSDLDQPGPTIIYANPAFERMTGWMAAEIVGKSPRILQGDNTERSVFGSGVDVWLSCRIAAFVDPETVT